MRIDLIVPLLTALTLSSCNPRAQSAAVANGKAEIEVAREFNSLFPETQNFISNYSGSNGTPRWNSKVGLHGRYVLSVHFDIRFDQSRTHPERDGEVSFFLAEVEKARQRATPSPIDKFDSASRNGRKS